MDAGNQRHQAIFRQARWRLSEQSCIRHALGDHPFDRASKALRCPPARHKRVLRDSIVIEILNPKTALFFLMFLPQFVDLQAAVPSWLQFLLLGIIVNGAFSLGDLASVGVASFVAPLISSPGSGAWVSKVSGIILVGLSVTIMAQSV